MFRRASFCVWSVKSRMREFAVESSFWRRAISAVWGSGWEFAARVSIVISKI